MPVRHRGQFGTEQRRSEDRDRHVRAPARDGLDPRHPRFVGEVAEQLDLESGLRAWTMGGSPDKLGEAFRTHFGPTAMAYPVFNGTGANVVALDYSADEVAATRGTFGAMVAAGEIDEARYVAAVQGDATRLPFDDATFDRVITSEVLEHIQDDVRAISELVRVLKPGGTFAATVPTWFPEKVNWMLSDEYHAPKSVGGHVRIYSSTELKAKLRTAGLDVIGSHRAHALHSPYWWLKCAYGLDNPDAGPVRRYHDFLCMCIERNPAWARTAERMSTGDGRRHAVVVFTVPMAHLSGIPDVLRSRFAIPIVFYDGDVPMSLPEFGGMDTGFNYYHGADPAEYDLVVSNSEGGLERLLELGARRAEAVFWGADPDFFTPHPVERVYDVFFYGYGDKFRREWMAALVGEPSRQLADVDFVLGGRDFRGDTGSARLVGDIPFNVFPHAISSARVNLCITRRSHASVYASSSARPFELASCGAAIVANPYDGIERWFEPGSELLVVRDTEEAVAAYRALLDDPGQAEQLGRRARERVLDEHTYRHRARRLLDLIGIGARAHGD